MTLRPRTRVRSADHTNEPGVEVRRQWIASLKAAHLADPGSRSGRICGLLIHVSLISSHAFLAFRSCGFLGFMIRGKPHLLGRSLIHSGNIAHLIMAAAGCVPLMICLIRGIDTRDWLRHRLLLVPSLDLLVHHTPVTREEEVRKEKLRVANLIMALVRVARVATTVCGFYLLTGTFGLDLYFSGSWDERLAWICWWPLDLLGVCL